MHSTEYMEPAEAGRYINPAHPVPPTTLQFWRHKGRGPKYFKVGRRIVYARADLDDFRKACRREPEPPHRSPQPPVQLAAPAGKGLMASMDDFGIICTSRYGVERELHLMNGISKLLLDDGHPVTELFCDSKAGSFSATLSVVDLAVAEEVAYRIAELLVCFQGGHNGIYIVCGRGLPLGWIGGHWGYPGCQFEAAER